MIMKLRLLSSVTLDQHSNRNIVLSFMKLFNLKDGCCIVEKFWQMMIVILFFLKLAFLRFWIFFLFQVCEEFMTKIQVFFLSRSEVQCYIQLRKSGVWNLEQRKDFNLRYECETYESPPFSLWANMHLLLR